MNRLCTALLLILLVGTPALAAKYDLQMATAMSNSTFATVVREAGMFTAYRAVAPAEPQGIIGFDIGIETSVVKLDTSAWDQAFQAGGTDAPDYIAVPRLHVRKGLPFNLDVGASYTYVPESDIRVIGGELQWAILEGSTVTPALAVRGHYSTLQGVDDLDLTSYGADAVISKGITIFTPYLGAGVVQIDGEYTGDNPVLQPLLQDKSFTEPRVFGGVEVDMTLIHLTLDAEYSRFPIYTAKLSVNW
jgi:hypothetical protein